MNNIIYLNPKTMDVVIYNPKTRWFECESGAYYTSELMLRIFDISWQKVGSL